MAGLNDVETKTDRIERRAALRDLLDAWDRDLGPISEALAAEARRAFDELDGTIGDGDSETSMVHQITNE